jgi:hypothetical protein
MNFTLTNTIVVPHLFPYILSKHGLKLKWKQRFFLLLPILYLTQLKITEKRNTTKFVKDSTIDLCDHFLSRISILYVYKQWHIQNFKIGRRQN